jgi:YidC/Oxa1 family membrane protein insertase
MHFLSLLYNDIVFRPLLNLLVFFYNIIPGHDVGIVIIVVTIFIRLLLAPSFHKSLKSQKAMNDLQPKLNEMRERLKDDKEGQAKAMMEIYKEHKINPLSSCLPLLIQLPILIGLYQVFSKALGGNELLGLYSFIKNPITISPLFLNLVDLSKPSWIFGVIAGAAQFWQSKLMMPKATAGQDMTAKAMSVQTMYVLPLISVFISLSLPAGLPLYWIVTTLFAVLQQYYIIRKQPKVGDVTVVSR